MSFASLFPVKKSIIGMIHLAGGITKKIGRALDEIAVYEGEGLDGIIVENYHGSDLDVENTLKAIRRTGTSLAIGVNILPNNWGHAFDFSHECGAGFIQVDYVAGKYTKGSINGELYPLFRKRYSHIVVLGGVHPKYYTPVPGSHLEDDLVTGKDRADAIVVTGEGTGIETPLSKIREFRSVLGEHPLIVGAGLTPETVAEQLRIADGAIVGSYFKIDNETENYLDRAKVRRFMDAVRELRASL